MDVIQALSILCPEEKTKAGLKKAYHKKSFENHPDRGGNVEIMKLINVAYEFLNNMNYWWTATQAREAKKTTPLTQTMQSKIDILSTFAGLKIEIIGSWLWASGNTFQVKTEIKAMGFRFSAKKSAWYYHEDKTYRKRGKKEFSMDDIRDLHGATTVSTSTGLRGLAA